MSKLPALFIWGADMAVSTVDKIDLDKLREKKIEIVAIDVDGTILGIIYRNHYDQHITGAIREWIEMAKEHFKVILLSNSKNQRKIHSIAKSLGVDDWIFRDGSKRPKPFGIRTALNEIGITNHKKVAIIGNNPLTDILGGRLAKVGMVIKTGHKKL